MDQEQILRLWLILGLSSLILLLVGAISNRVTVYRDYHDLGWSLAFILAPVVGFFVIVFIAGENVDSWEFATGTPVGITTLSVTCLTVAISGLQTFRLSMQDNGPLLGVLVGAAKLVIAVLIAISSIGLLRYLFRESRSFGHIAIFFILFGVLGWFVNTLVNGDRTGAVTAYPEG